ncbi:hypothetical protein DV738_g2753, partial [Chaetothyriales sp. CBS 135597]
MGRRKASPTPRGELLGAFIANAHSSLPPRPSSAQSKASPPVAGKVGVKPARSSQPPAGAHAKHAAAVSSTMASKPKSPEEEVSSKETPDAPSSTLTLRSSKKNPTSSQPPLTEAFPNKRPKIESAPRYPSRIRKPVLGSPTPDPDSVSQPTRRQKEALALLQGSEVSDEMPSALPTPPADSVYDGPAVEGHSTPHKASPGVDSAADVKADEGGRLAKKQSRISINQLVVKPASPDIEDSTSRAHAAPAARGKDSTSSSGSEGNSSSSIDSSYADVPSQSLPLTPATASLPALHPSISSPTGKSSPPIMPRSASPGSAPQYNWTQTSQPPWSVQDVGTHTFINSTKGQKVKGRPFTKARQANSASRVRNVANTYPRKQPFKAQIMFDGYPSEDQPMREGLTLWEICQEYPNHLTGKVLEGFVQKEWSANELCACLKDDARKVLTDRPGKDKTMVFQKRLERVKKDLMAKNEYDQLMKGAEIRPDGRPTWVKRGNLRLKIYACCFEDSYTRYWREKKVQGTKVVKVTFCRGPRQHALLATCRQVYLEAAPILADSAYFLLDQTKASSALIAIDYLFEHGAFSPWLVTLMQRTRRLVLSKPGEAVFWKARPIFNSVERVDMFGFYPTLNRWVNRDRTIAMGWGVWYWKIFWYRSRMRPTKNPRVNLSRIARWLHANLDQPSKRPGLYLHAWELEDDDGTEGCGKAYYVTVDLDTREILTKERIMFRTKLDRCGSLLENHIKQYHDFIRVTNERRHEWLREERKRWPELYSVTAIASEAEK